MLKPYFPIKKKKKVLEFNKVILRPINLGEDVAYQLEFHTYNKVFHKNLDLESMLLESQRLVEESFKQLNIFCKDKEVQLLAAKPDKPHLSTSKEPPKIKPQELNLDHNKVKNYVIPDGTPCDFLIKLKVMDKAGKVIPKHYNKFRQINRYLEIVEDVFPHLPENKTLKIIDFGCGKAYLTFALYYYLKILKNRNVDIIGLDLKEDVIDFCSKVAIDLRYEDLKFMKGDIADFTSDYADMVVTLHACDTATDYALINAVRWNTKVILSVPCCQHELFKQINNSIHQPMLKHGILKDRLTEYLTDGLRAIKLEEKGYNVAMIEFTSLEHTGRNIMIKAVKNKAYNKAKVIAHKKEYEALKNFYQVSPTIDEL